MNKLKVFMYGRPLREIYPHATRFQVFKYRVMSFLVKTVKWSLGLSFGMAVMLGFFMAGYWNHPKPVHADPIESIAPVLVRIAKAESHNSHFCTIELARVKMCAKSEVGQVLVRTNKDGTADAGRYQINLYHWGKVASDKGLNLFDEQDNEEFAVWLFETRGTVDWEASRKEWNK